MSARTRRHSLREDFADARNSFRGPRLPRIPYQERSWLRLRSEALYRSEPMQRIRGSVEGLVSGLRGHRDPALPPHRLQRAVGGGDYRAVGEEFRRLFVELGGLKPDHDVLDVGSGSGRIAHALSGWLSGRYEGFDVFAPGVEWCRREITPRHPSFGFQVADIRNRRYNPAGTCEAADYRFPYDDDSFDFAFLTSVFTHLQEPAVANYLAELARVLRPGGRCFATWFLINEEAVRLMGGNGQFGVDQGTQLVVDEAVPERAVAFRESAVRELHDARGLHVEAVHYGSWCGRERFASFQDITIAVRR